MERIHAPKKHTACFRFYEELNDFLGDEQKKKSFPVTFIGNPSIKDTIEAIGVPHTEIDLILVNSVSVGFDYRLKGEERVSVYPVFESLDITPLLHLRPEPLRNTKFIADVNLGRLARKLRLGGFDTLYKNNYSDNEIICLSLNEKRIILTRDRGILKHNTVTHGYWIRNTNSSKQLQEVIRYFQLQNSMLPFTRCPCCNGLLEEVDKTEITNRIPEKTAYHFNNFKKCPDCGKIYWQGSHFTKIRKMIEQLR
ncbi:MAG: Mut7-C RNAse domain-containing protein [Fidelibacterota bacterium]